MSADLRVVDPDERASDRHRREAYASASAWTIEAAETDHRLVMRIAGRVGRRQRLTPDETAAMFRRHVEANPACPVCRGLIRGAT